MSFHPLKTSISSIKKLANCAHISLVDDTSILRSLKNLSLVLLGLFVCHLSLLDMDEPFALNLFHLFLQLLLLFHEALLFRKGGRASVPRIFLILNLFLLFLQLSFKAHFVVLLCLSHGQARSRHLLSLELLELLNLVLLGEVLLVARLLRFLLSLSFLAN